MADERTSRQGSAGRQDPGARPEGAGGGTQLGRPQGEGGSGLRPWRDDPFLRFHERMNSLFDDFARGFGLGPAPGGSPLSALGGFGGAGTMPWPSVDVSWDPERVHVEADLPGMEEKDVEITIERGQLLISGEKLGESESKGRQWSRRERTWGSFRRVVPLPEDVVPDRAEARFQRGVLTIDVPRQVDERNRPRRIPVKGA